MSVLGPRDEDPDRVWSEDPVEVFYSPRRPYMVGLQIGHAATGLTIREARLVSRALWEAAGTVEVMSARDAMWALKDGDPMLDKLTPLERN